MARAVYIEDLNDVAPAVSQTGNRVPSRGHKAWSMTVKFKSAGGAPSKAVKLKGTNDPADTTGETLITITGTANGSTSASVDGKCYRYVFVVVDAGADLTVDEVRVYGSGTANTE